MRWYFQQLLKVVKKTKKQKTKPLFRPFQVTWHKSELHISDLKQQRNVAKFSRRNEIEDIPETVTGYVLQNNRKLTWYIGEGDCSCCGGSKVDNIHSHVPWDECTWAEKTLAVQHHSVERQSFRNHPVQCGLITRFEILLKFFTNLWRKPGGCWRFLSEFTRPRVSHLCFSSLAAHSSFLWISVLKEKRERKGTFVFYRRLPTLLLFSGVKETTYVFFKVDALFLAGSPWGTCLR